MIFWIGCSDGFGCGKIRRDGGRGRGGSVGWDVNVG